MAKLVALPGISDNANDYVDNKKGDNSKDKEKSKDEEAGDDVKQEVEKEIANPKIRFLTSWLDSKPVSERPKWFQHFLDNLQMDALTHNLLMGLFELAATFGISKLYR